MTQSLQYRRLLWLALLVVLAYCGLGWRLVEMQYLGADTARQQFAQTAVEEVIEVPMRGSILDRNGVVLTTSVRQYDIAADPSYIQPYGAGVAAALAGPLKMEVAELRRLLSPVTRHPVTGQSQTNRFVMLKKGATFDEWNAADAALRTNSFGLDRSQLSRKELAKLRDIRSIGVRLESEVQSRQYPNGAVAGQVLGYVDNRTGGTSASGTFRMQTGMAGVERRFNQNLSGVPGRKRVIRSEFVERVERIVPVADGQDVVSTLDRRIQEILDRELIATHKELGAKAAFGVVMDVNSFEVLAMGSAPGFAPAERTDFDQERVRNRSILDEFEPGSIFKVIAIAAALEEGVVDLTTPIDCMNGHMPVPGSRPLTDAHPQGVLTVKGVVTKSSNIGTAKIERLLGDDRYYRWVEKFGIGVSTGLGLAEGSGRLDPKKNFRPVDFTRLPIGYGVGVTQMQLATIYSAIANGGTMKQPRIVTRVQDREGRVIGAYPPVVVDRLVSPETARKMIEALQTVPTPEGTARDAALEHYTVAGKTGTAYKWNAKANPPGYDNDRYYSSFVGFFPATNPRICIAITVDEPEKKAGTNQHQGGKAAGPTFRRIAEQIAAHLNIPPDRESVEPRDPELFAAVNASAPATEVASATVSTEPVSRRPAAPTGFRLGHVPLPPSR